MLTVCYINRQPGRWYHYSDTNACGESAASKNMSGDSCIMELFSFCKGGYFNIHIWAWFGYFICSKRGISFYILSCFSNANKRAFHENPDHIYTELTFTFKAYITKYRMPLSSAEIFEDPVDPDQTASILLGPYCMLLYLC